MSSPLQRLRAQTQVLHQALEATPVAQALLSPGLTLAAYTEILSVWAAGWQTLEPALFAAPYARTVPHLLPIPRLQQAQADLQYLDALRACDQSARSSHAERLAAAAGVWAGTPASLSGFIGVCYVLRGASLGGMVIARHLERTLALDAAHGAAFFNAESGDGLSWVQWMRSADAALLADDDIDAACRAAGDTFALLLHLFSAPPIAVAGAPASLRDTAVTGADLDN